MADVLCFGEALIDFIASKAAGSDAQVLGDGFKLPHFGQYPGGAPANAAVAVAKLGGSAGFIGQVGADQFGDFLQQALQHYGVDCRYLLRHPTAKTALAFVSHDDQGERSFSFYRDNSADLLFRTEQLTPAMFSGARLLHFCSNTLVQPEIAAVTAEVLTQAREQGLWLSLDVNLRHNLWPAGHADAALVRRFVAMADIIKFSASEISYLTDDISAYVASLLAGQAQLVVITDDDQPIRYFSRHCSGVLPVPQVTVVDTTCGGDAFMGGLLYQLCLLADAEPGLNRNELNKMEFSQKLANVLQSRAGLEPLLGFAARCGAHTVTRPGAFPALPVLADVLPKDVLPAAVLPAKKPRVEIPE